MKLTKLDKMVKGWFVGDFEPTAHRTSAVEVAVKKYAAGERDAKHLHKIATELTLIVSGTVQMNGVRYTEGDIVVMEPGEATDFEAITDAVNVVVKLPSVANDKYIGAENDNA